MPKGHEQAHQPSAASRFFGALANRTSLAAGRASTFILAVSVVIVWAVSGPLFGFSDTWQLVINTGTTIVTFLMVFLIQKFTEPRQRGDPGQARRAHPRWSCAQLYGGN